jgi:tRNA-specific 2-thiouridylase
VHPDWSFSDLVFPGFQGTIKAQNDGKGIRAVRFIVGMSGGVDSSLTAALLKQQGHDVIGVTLQLYDYETTLEETDPSKRHCHPLAFIQDARDVANKLGIEHRVLSHQHIFQSQIINPFIESYKKGHTPLPCAKCNRDVKTAALYAVMQELGAEALATGHYVRRIDAGHGVQIHQGQDPIRDQSFFLFALENHYFEKMHFPLGHYSKSETRSKALDFGLSVAETPASQDLCFIAKKSYKTLFEATPGDIVHIDDGRVLGTHQGVTGFTLGQRQGLGIGGQSESLHVISLDVPNNRVIVGPRHHLAQSHIHLENVNWIAHDLQNPSSPDTSHSIGVKIRSSGRGMPATVSVHSGLKTALVSLESPDYAIAPGQACVFYQGTRLLGGGWIAEQRSL